MSHNIAEFFSREVFSMLLHKGLINLELVEKILSWHHTGFNVHSKVRATTKREAERVGKYMIRPLLSLKQLSIDETEGKVCYQYDKDSSELERMDYVEFIARVTSHIPDKGQVSLEGELTSPFQHSLRSLPPLLGQGLHPDLRPKGHTPLDPPDGFIKPKPS